MRRRRGGFLLVVALMMAILLFTMGMGYLGKRSAQYQGASSQIKAAQARALAEAGLEDARVKLEKDLFFPPPGDEDQLQFSYGEELRDANTDEVVGSYFVTIDSKYKRSPDPPNPKFPSVMLVECLGSLGPDPTKPEATVRLKMEVDLDEGDPGPPLRGPTKPYRISDWSDD